VQAGQVFGEAADDFFRIVIGAALGGRVDVLHDAIVPVGPLSALRAARGSTQ
jgi:hypothetical protein